MTDHKIKAIHRQRAALVYIRQSTAAQVEHNRESTARQYALVERAGDLGWPKEQVMVIDEDLAITGSIVGNRAGFERMASEVALGRVGIILGIEVSRLARNNANWYRLLDLCAITDTLIGDSDGLYYPGLFNDRLVLGLKGTMSEAELHVIRARLDGGIRNKAQRGELRRELPVGLVWGAKDGEVRFHADEAVVGAIRAVFDRFAEMGSVRQVWIWFRTQGLRFPSQKDAWGKEIQWIVPTYGSIHQVLTNPVYAGAYVYGRNHSEQYLDEQGVVRKRSRRLPMKEWPVLIQAHHVGFLDWPAFQANQERIRSNARAERHQSGGAVREGSALLQGIASCGHCSRGLFTYYRGHNATPGYRCSANELGDGGGHYCFQVGAVAMRRSGSGGWRSNALATKPSVRSADTAPWNQRIAWSLAGWKKIGRIGYAIWSPPKMNSIDANNIRRVVSIRIRSSAFARWVSISAKSGLRPRRRIATAKNCCELCWRKSSSR